MAKPSPVQIFWLPELENTYQNFSFVVSIPFPVSIT
jgi:hypothetical protein